MQSRSRVEHARPGEPFELHLLQLARRDVRPTGVGRGRFRGRRDRRRARGTVGVRVYARQRLERRRPVHEPEAAAVASVVPRQDVCRGGRDGKVGLQVVRIVRQRPHGRGRDDRLVVVAVLTAVREPPFGPGGRGRAAARARRGRTVRRRGQRRLARRVPVAQQRLDAKRRFLRLGRRVSGGLAFQVQRARRVPRPGTRVFFDVGP